MGVLWGGGVEVAMRSQLLKHYDDYREGVRGVVVV
jgi:hypothetical protein